MNLPGTPRACRLDLDPQGDLLPPGEMAEDDPGGDHGWGWAALLVGLSMLSVFLQC